ncbi:MAG: GntR family transcriptional regulator [Paracoccus sp. (in: a-proteobacteria)]|nr:GntR family transcriptional regulator [Paracoccus sp. (in: a-proteobacteria)]
MSVTNSPLALRIARDIKAGIAAGQIAPGDHMRAQKLADQFGVSRSPVREALLLLMDEGFLDQQQNRGFFVRHDLPQLDTAPPDDDAQPFEEPGEYQTIAADWLTDRIPAEVTEQYLRDRYALTKTQLGYVLLRAVREGWAERKDGYGWRFLPVAKTPETFEQIYRFRMQIEPAAMLEPGYTVDHAALAEQRRIQQRMLDHDIEHAPGERLLDYGAQFHEELIKFCRNPFFHQALVRVNRMRRLMEYRSRVDRRRLYNQCTEHLEMLDLLERGEIAEAANFMRRHLGGALETKSPVVLAPDGYQSTSKVVTTS